MGGQLFKDVETPRMSYASYHRRVRDMLQKEHGSLYQVPTVFGDKQDFGDLDVVGLMTTSVFVDDMAPISFVKHDPTTVSLLMQDAEGFYQVDYRCVELGTLDFAARYFSNNDLGNLIGRLAHRMGLKFGFEGLIYCLNDGTKRLGEFTLTTDFDTALDHLGFESKPRTFETRLDAFDWMLTSRYFVASAFPLEHQSHRARVRDRKRPTYNGFLQYLSANGHCLDYVKSNPSAFLEYHFNRFPELRAWYERTLQVNTDKVRFKQLFGGSAVRDCTGLSGPELGSFMEEFKGTLSMTDLSLQMTEEDASDVIRLFYKAYQKIHS